MKKGKFLKIFFSLSLTLAILFGMSVFATDSATDTPAESKRESVILDANIVLNNKESLDKLFSIESGKADIKLRSDTLDIEASEDSVIKILNFPDNFDEYKFSVNVVLKNNGSKDNCFYMGVNSQKSNELNAGVQLKFGFNKDGSDAKFGVDNFDGSTNGLGNVPFTSYGDGFYGQENLKFEILVQKDFVSFSINGTLISKINKSDLAFDSGAPYFKLGADMSAHISGIDLRRVIKGSDNNVKFYGHQRSVIGGSYYGLRFVFEMKDTTDYKYVGQNIRVFDSNGDMIRNFTRKNSVVYKTLNKNNNDGTLSSISPGKGYEYMSTISLMNIPSNLGRLTYKTTFICEMLDGSIIYYEASAIEYNGDMLMKDIIHW